MGMGFENLNADEVKLEVLTAINILEGKITLASLPTDSPAARLVSRINYLDGLSTLHEMHSHRIPLGTLVPLYIDDIEEKDG